MQLVGHVVSQHSPSASRRRRGTVAALAVAAVLVPVTFGQGVAGAHAQPAAAAAAAAPQLIPQPVSLHTTSGGDFTLTRTTKILVPKGSARADGVGTYLARVLRPSTGYPLPVATPSARDSAGNIALQISPSAAVGREGYRLDVTTDGVRLTARSAEALFDGVQTLRQLLPAKVERRSVQPGPWTMPGVAIADHARFAWRGAMLDVSRHFFTVAQVERYIDLLAMYKINMFHLHLSDDQGWRIQIKGWPRLTSVGGSTEVGGGPGGFYTQKQYSDIVRYAAQRFITLVPEIDGPSHSNAALASYAQLNCDGKAPPLYTGTDVGFSSFCVHNAITYKFLDDVIGQLAGLTPGPYLHIGGDEAHSTTAADYVYYVQRLQQIVHAHGKTMIGWHQIGSATLSPGQIAQYWGTAGSKTDIDLAHQAVKQGAKLVMSPADKDYIDMKYNPTTKLGLNWAGYNGVRDAYDWDPTTSVPGITETDVQGVEAPLWSETLLDLNDIEYMAFPRIAGIGEIGWSPQSLRSWSTYKVRLAAQGPRWTAMGVTFYHSPLVPWQ
jgi:hexosaminidase